MDKGEAVRVLEDFEGEGVEVALEIGVGEFTSEEAFDLRDGVFFWFITEEEAPAVPMKRSLSLKQTMAGVSRLDWTHH